MDIQTKKGLLDVVVLSTLIKGDSYGYKIVQEVSRVVDISESTLYPILRRLEAAAALTTYSVEHRGRLRKYYKLTNEGYGKVKLFIEDWDEIKRVYNFIVANARGKWRQ